MAMVAQDGCIFSKEGDCDSERLSSWPKVRPRRAGTRVGLLCPSSTPSSQLQTRMCSHTYTNTRTHTHAQVCTQARTHTYVCKHKYTQTRARAHARTRLHTACVHTCTCTHAYARSHSHTQPHMYIHTHACTNTHPCVCTPHESQAPCGVPCSGALTPHPHHTWTPREVPHSAYFCMFFS